MKPLGRPLEDPHHPQRPEPGRPAGDHDIEQATDGDIFLAYLEQVLGPKLRPGDVVVMDNLSAHKWPGFEQLIQAAGAELLYLPPYSPDLNPIEKAWAKLKQLLAPPRPAPPKRSSKLSPNSYPSTPENAQAWFRHSGINYIS